MKAIKLLHKNLLTACPDIHEVRLKALMAGVASALREHQVTVTSLGRNLKSKSKTHTKHDIKRMDRLIGNKHLHAERKDIYQYLSKQLVGHQKHPILIADWSPMPGREMFQLLRVSIPMGGRSLTIYEECFKEKQLNSTQVHDTFLDELDKILPERCKPIILSDAIFKTPWLLVAHLPEVFDTPKKIVSLYRQRMQIEEGFRDTKNQQYGIGLAQAKSKHAKRYNNLLLVAALTLFLLWCIGRAAVDKKFHYRLQANTIRHKAVLSYIYIAMQIINDKRYKIKKKELRPIFEQISQFTRKVESVI